MEIQQIITPLLYTEKLAAISANCLEGLKGQWAANIYQNATNGFSQALRDKVDGLKKVLNGKCTFKPEDLTRPAKAKYGIYQGDKKVALLKLVPNQPVSSFKDVTIEGPNWQRELIGFEIDQLLGLNLVPAQVAAKVNINGEIKYGIIQTFIPDAKGGIDLLNTKGGGKLLKELPKEHVQHLALSSMIKGRAAGHFNNTIFTKDRGYEIDLEEVMHPTYCRSAVLGLPQNALPLNSQARMVLNCPTLATLAQNYGAVAAQHYAIGKNPFTALTERLQHLRKAPTTPRDIYFENFGRKELAIKLKEQGWPDIIAWNQGVQDPYKHIVKDPNNIPKCGPWKNPQIIALEKPY